MKRFFQGLVFILPSLVLVHPSVAHAELLVISNPDKVGAPAQKKIGAPKLANNKSDAGADKPKTKLPQKDTHGDDPPVPETDELTSLMDDSGQDDDCYESDDDSQGFFGDGADPNLPANPRPQTIISEAGIDGLAETDAGDFFSADPANLDLLWPVETRTISSAWGPRVRYVRAVVKDRNGNKRRISKPYTGVHKGIDLTAPLGNGVFAAMDGQVSDAGRSKKLGNYVRIYHGNGVETVYGHNRANLAKTGDLVRRGQIIARVGSTGRSSGPHVHFEVRVNDQQINPMPWLNDSEEIQAEILARYAEFQSISPGGR